MTILDDFPTPVKPSRPICPRRGPEPWQRVTQLPPSRRYFDPTPSEDRAPQTDDLIRGTIVGHTAGE